MNFSKNFAQIFFYGSLCDKISKLYWLHISGTPVRTREIKIPYGVGMGQKHLHYILELLPHCSWMLIDNRVCHKGFWLLNELPFSTHQDVPLKLLNICIGWFCWCQSFTISRKCSAWKDLKKKFKDLGPKNFGPQNFWVQF